VQTGAGDDRAVELEIGIGRRIVARPDDRVRAVRVSGRGEARPIADRLVGERELGRIGSDLSERAERAKQERAVDAMERAARCESSPFEK
jgi:hypothetical protein